MFMKGLMLHVYIILRNVNNKIFFTFSVIYVKLGIVLIGEDLKVSY